MGNDNNHEAAASRKNSRGGTVGVVECRPRGASTRDGAEIVDGEYGVEASSTQIQIRSVEREDLAQVGSFGYLPGDGHVTFSILWADPLPATPPEGVGNEEQGGTPSVPQQVVQGIGGFGVGVSTRSESPKSLG
ncbi:hypothetical protein CH272_14130 [Rhodococcus sp. 05-340-1]|nr:hypothetical protein CH271_02680 [Rhodococcus sp. 05-340-2]OZD76080.1 hypothetical protein CH272_14130 [Rhodococcus sp. 05-340-1]